MYFLASTIVILLNVLFLTKIFGAPASNERTLLLFIINVIQIILAFAIFYRRQLGLRTGQAFFEVLRVFGTLGYPEGAEFIIGCQITIDFMLFAVFLSFFVGNLGQGR